ncbi:hypothetical protein [Streptomyces sp. SPB074]|uniref:hypothetical protein n=1 Tax=Streptomyces sp. (strain SPB074) TaxID=465543 RepID=UPI00017F1913|nr:hypothetical protein [Streptomyces sp. SPB074]
MTVRSEDVVGLIEATLALAFPTASTQGLTRAAEAVARWGAEDAAQYLDDPLTLRMITDLLQVAGVPEGDYRPAEPAGRAMEWESEYRVWSHTDEMPDLPYLPRPPDRPRHTRQAGHGERPPYEGDERYGGDEGYEGDERYGGGAAYEAERPGEAGEAVRDREPGPGRASGSESPAGTARPGSRRWPFPRPGNQGPGD